MEYKTSDIAEVLEVKDWTNRQKMDKLLHMDAIMYSNLGTDSTTLERKAVKAASKKIYRAILTLDKAIGELLLKEIDNDSI
jgi:hypothetical protein